MAMVAASLSLVVAGCQATSDERNPGPCPAAGVLYEADRVVTFDGPATLENVAYSGEITGVSTTCRYFDDRPIVQNLRIEFAFGRGANAQGDTHAYRYFVAVTRDGVAMLEKRVFEVDIDFDDKRTVTRKEEIEQIVIPRANPTTSGGNFEIVVGFQLTPAQLAFNRSRRSLVAPDL